MQPFLYSLAAIVAGVVVEIYTYQIVRLFGHADWAEKYLGAAGTYTAWRLFGVVLIGAGFWGLAGILN